MDVAAIRQGLADTVESVTGLRPYTYDAGGMVPPFMVVGWPDITYDEAFSRGHHTLIVPLTLIVARVMPRDAANKVADYLSQPDARSVADAVRNDKTLGGYCDHARVASASVDVVGDNGDLIEITFSVTCYAAGG